MGIGAPGAVTEVPAIRTDFPAKGLAEKADLKGIVAGGGFRGEISSGLCTPAHAAGVSPHLLDLASLQIDNRAAAEMNEIMKVLRHSCSRPVVLGSTLEDFIRQCRIGSRVVYDGFKFPYGGKPPVITVIEHQVFAVGNSIVERLERTRISTLPFILLDGVPGSLLGDVFQALRRIEGPERTVSDTLHIAGGIIVVVTVQGHPAVSRSHAPRTDCALLSARPVKRA